MGLLPCPFCDSSDFKNNSMLWGATKWYFITCKNCKCRMQHFDKNLLRERWNKRIITNINLPISTESVDRWISVKERTPDKMQLVLIYAPNEPNLKIRIGLFDDWVNIDHTLGITHWQPLPKPPKEI